MKLTTKENICPLCGGDNQCAMASNQPADTCWCQSTTISPAALAAISPESVGVRCVCPSCGRPKGDTSSER